jgi:uncharacterized protein (TIGR02118 family)
VITVFSLMRRRPDIDVAAFQAHWLDPHGVLVCRFPKLRHYSQNRIVAALSPAARRLQLDGIAELSYDSHEDQEAATNSLEMAACDVDSPLFIGAVVRIVAEAQAVLPAPGRSGVPKLMLLFPPGAALPERPVFGQVTGHSEAITRVQRGPASAMPVLEFPVDRITELWFDDQPALAHAARALVPACGDQVALLAIEEVRLV